MSYFIGCQTCLPPPSLSFSPLPTKPRLVDSPHSPHEVLRLIQGMGINLARINLFDARWTLGLL